MTADNLLSDKSLNKRSGKGKTFTGSDLIVFHIDGICFFLLYILLNVQHMELKLHSSKALTLKIEKL